MRYNSLRAVASAGLTNSMDSKYKYNSKLNVNVIGDDFVVVLYCDACSTASKIKLDKYSGKRSIVTCSKCGNKFSTSHETRQAIRKEADSVGFARRAGPSNVGAKKFTIRIVDVSMTGARIVMTERDFNMSGYGIDDSINLSFTLPGDKAEASLDIDAEIKNVKKVKNKVNIGLLYKYLPIFATQRLTLFLWDRTRGDTLELELSEES